MEMDFVYWRHPSVPGIKIEEVTGGGRYKGQLWAEMARQVYCENGRDAYREVGHFKNGAPFLFGETSRISITHCSGMFAVATLPPTPEVDLSEYSERAALGIDAERVDREQVLKVRDRFLSADELKMIPADDVALNVIAWTVKEAAYKAIFIPGIDFREHIRIARMPKFAPPTPVFDPKEYGLDPNEKDLPEEFFGEVVIVTDKSDWRDGKDKSESDGNVGDGALRMKIYTYLVDDELVVTLCYAPRCAKFGKRGLL